MVNTKIRFIILFAGQRCRSSIQSAKIRLGADCGSEHVLRTAKFSLKLKKVGKITRPFRYNLNQIPYDYQVEVTNNQGIRSDRQSAWRTVGRRFVTLYRRWWSNPSLRKRNAKRQNGCLGRPYKYLWKGEKQQAKEKRKDISIWSRVAKNSKKR